MMKIKMYLFLFTILCFSCSPIEERMDMGQSDSTIADLGSDSSTVVPENCGQYDGDKNACMEAGCNRWNDHSELWCIKDGKCLIDKNNNPGFCGHAVGDFSQANFGFFRTDKNIATDFGIPPGGPWDSCPEDVDDHPLCKCRSLGLNATEGSCF